MLRTGHLGVCIAVGCIKLDGLGRVVWIADHLLLLSWCIICGSSSLSLLLVAVLLQWATASSQIRGCEALTSGCLTLASLEILAERQRSALAELI